MKKAPIIIGLDVSNNETQKSLSISSSKSNWLCFSQDISIVDTFVCSFKTNES